MPLPLSFYTGTYENSGYGSFTLCDPGSTSDYCIKVLGNFSSVDNAMDHLCRTKDIPQLFGAWPRLWSTHIRFIHFDSNEFNVSMTALFSMGYGLSKMPFETFEMDQYAARAEFVVEDNKIIGVGFFKTEGVDGMKGDGIPVQNPSTVWFARL